jgi:MFS transporter, DHA2 family, methylenomycin A resistance protein
LMSAVISSVSKELTGTASGVLNSSRQIGAMLGVAVFGAMLSESGSLVGGLHRSLILSAIILAGGSLLSFSFIPDKRRER